MKRAWLPIIFSVTFGVLMRPYGLDLSILAAIAGAALGGGIGGWRSTAILHSNPPAPSSVSPLPYRRMLFTMIDELHSAGIITETEAKMFSGRIVQQAVTEEPKDEVPEVQLFEPRTMTDAELTSRKRALDEQLKTVHKI